MTRISLAVLCAFVMCACTLGDASPSLHAQLAKQALAQGSSLGPPPAPNEPDWNALVTNSTVATEPAGTSAGGSSVTADGAFTYTIPISLPPGRMGVAPELALTYSSRAGNGIVGVGWSIAGLPKITRCRKTLAHEEVAERVLFNATDRFCLDGQKLEVVSGAYGADGAEYRTERYTPDQIRSRGQSEAGPDLFEIRHGDGTISTFGRQPDVEYGMYLRGEVGGQPVLSSPVVYGWLLSEHRDRFGNRIVYDYREPANGAAGEAAALPSRIYYTGDTTRSYGTRRVEFEYENRPDPSVRYVSGMPFSDTERLKEIRVLGPRTFGGEPELLWRYELRYEQAPVTRLSRLSKVIWCDPTGGCQGATEFKWGHSWGFQDGDPALFAYHPVHTVPSVAVDAARWMAVSLADVDGDGKDDLAYQPRHPSETRSGDLGGRSNLADQLRRG